MLERLAAVMSRVWPTLSLDVPLEHEALSRDPERLAAVKADALNHRRLTARATVATLDALAWTEAHAGDWRLPLLIFHGTDDRIIDPAGTVAFADGRHGRRRDRRRAPPLRGRLPRGPQRPRRDDRRGGRRRLDRSPLSRRPRAKEDRSWSPGSSSSSTPPILAPWASSGRRPSGYRTPAPPEGFDDWDAWARAQGIPEERLERRQRHRGPGGRRAAHLHPARARRERWPRTDCTWTST